MTHTTVRALALGLVTALAAAISAPVTASAADTEAPVDLVTTLPGGATGTALDPGGDLYVASPRTGRSTASTATPTRSRPSTRGCPLRCSPWAASWTLPSRAPRPTHS